uniref:Neprilysin n=1 Tax=Hemiscolopendra marginata TaxID=943146 RepID=A0A646QJ38_9MYRI
MALTNKRYGSNKKNNTCLVVTTVLLVIVSLVLLGLLIYFALEWKVEKDRADKITPCPSKGHDSAALHWNPDDKMKTEAPCVCEDCTLALQKKEDEAPCFTRDCILTASSLLSAMDETVKPCENFFDFACRNFIRKHPVPDKVMSTSTFTQYQDLLNLQQKILIENYDSYKKTPVLVKAQEVYHVCINSSYQKQKEINSFKTFIQKDLGGWPLLEGRSWKPKFKLEELFTKLLQLDLDTDLFDLNLINHPENPTEYLFKISVRALDTIMTRDAIFSPTDKGDTLRQKIFWNVANILGNPSKPEMYEDFSQMKKFEEHLNMITADTSGEEADVMPYKDLDKLTNNTINWFKVVRNAFGDKLVKADDVVVVAHPNQFKKIPALLKRYNSRVLVNRIITSNIFLKLLPIIGLEMNKEMIDLMKEIGYNIPNKSGRSQRCLEFVSEVFPAVITRMFVEVYADSETRTEAAKIVEHILAAYKEQIEKSQWVDEQTKANALLKIKKMKKFIEYPDFTFEDEELEDHYSEVPDVESTNFLNYINMNPIKEWKKMEVMLFPTSSKQWPVHPMDINAVYYAQYNAMYFPVGILQLPFFDVHRPSLVNYAISGSVVGHELGHAFDNNGKNYDADGKFINWWTNSTSEEFEMKSECFIEQYSSYCPEELVGGPGDPEICVNGENTLGENLADFTGLKAAFEGYKIYIKEKGKEKPLPGLEKYTPEQLFFISYAHTWCENIPPDNWVASYATDEHSPSKYRIFGTLSNSKDFRDAFHCEKGLMNRAEETCTLW